MSAEVRGQRSKPGKHLALEGVISLGVGDIKRQSKTLKRKYWLDTNVKQTYKVTAKVPSKFKYTPFRVFFLISIPQKPTLKTTKLVRIKHSWLSE